MLGRLDRQRALSRGSASLIWDEKGAEDLMESYRALRTNLEFLMDETTKVIEITSPEAAQGKSTVVANLAVAFSRIGIETIVLDADLRRPRQHEIFGLDNSSGLSTMLALGRKAELKPAGQGLWVITSGPVPPDPTEMLHIRLPSVIKALRRRKALILSTRRRCCRSATRASSRRSPTASSSSRPRARRSPRASRPRSTGSRWSTAACSASSSTRPARTTSTPARTTATRRPAETAERLETERATGAPGAAARRRQERPAAASAAPRTPAPPVEQV